MKTNLRPNLWIAIFTIFTALVSPAMTLTPQQALKRACKDGAMRELLSRSDSPVLVKTIKGKASQEPVIYIFSDHEKSYVLSSSEKSIAVLGYTDRPIDQRSNLSPGLEGFLHQYIAELENNISQSEAKAAENDIVGLDAIEPQCKTEWGQIFPYFLQTPFIENVGRTSVTGCVATAMAQVFKYHEFPKRGTGTITYHWNYGNQDLSMNCDVQFDWAHMRDTYPPDITTDQENNAVALLMKACGYAAEMEYTHSDSGGLTTVGIRNWIKHFGYDKDAICLNRIHYSLKEWRNMLHANLKECGPLLYEGYGSGAHAFVCDGYDGKGYFHFNWGWDGNDNGYFSLSALTPDQYSDFTFNQTAYFGIKPDDGQDLQTIRMISEGLNVNLFLPGNDGFQTIALSGMQKVIAIGYDSSCEIELSVVFRKDGSDEIVYSDIVENEYDDENPNVFLYYTLPKLEDGMYNISLLWRPKSLQDNGNEWRECDVSPGRSRQVRIKFSDGVAELANQHTSGITLVEFRQLTPIVLDKEFKIEAEFRNESGEELLYSLQNYLLDDESNRVAYFWGGNDGYNVLQAGETVVIKYKYIGWFVPKENKSGIYRLEFYDHSGRKLTGDPIAVELLEAPDEEIVLRADNITYRSNDEELSLEMDLTCVSGYYGSKIWAKMNYPSWSGNIYSEDLYMMPGVTKHVVIEKKIPEHLWKGELPYRLTLYYSKADTPYNEGNGIEQLAPELVFNLGDSGEVTGIDVTYMEQPDWVSISSDGIIYPKYGVAITIFDMTGREIVRETKQSVRLPQRGVYIIRSTRGAIKTVY